MNRLLDFSGPHKAISYSISPLSNNRALCAGAALYEQAVRKTELAHFLPSREQMFILSFFDQYALSHPPLAPDGSALAFAGHHVSPVSAQPPGTSTVCH